MKKILIASLTALFILSGCSNNNKKINNPTFSTKVDQADEVVAKNDQISITNQDIYQYLMGKYGGELVLDNAIKAIAEKEITDEKAIKEELEPVLNTYKAYIGEDLDAYAVEQLNYPDFATYQEEMIIPSVKKTLLIKTYANEHYSELAPSYNFKKLKVVQYDTQDEANEVNGKLQSGEITFEAVAKEKTGTENGADLGLVYTKISNVDSSIVGLLPNLTDKGLYSTPVALSTGKYAIIYVEEFDIEVFKDEAVQIVYGQSETTIKCEQHYLKLYEFKVNENAIIDQINAIDPNYLK